MQAHPKAALRAHKPPLHRLATLLATLVLMLVLALVATSGPSHAQAGFRLPPGLQDPALLIQLGQAYQGEFADRSRYRQDDGRPLYLNRMLLEPSPYLRQHAHTPIDWWGWSPEALARAARENKPIFLSIGYATCHWCHVMEEESFDNEALAAQINADFIAIKVDREQHPEVDLLYMTSLQLTAETAGWPVTAVLLPSGEPFFIASYLPPETLALVLSDSRRMWQESPGDLEAFAFELAGAVQRFMALEGAAQSLDLPQALAAAHSRVQDIDPQHGGFGTAPKFPNETSLAWFADLVEVTADPQLALALRRTLDGLQAGGIHDQIGGGFHRYAVDRAWRLPHFEKMLYNQAQLLTLFARAARMFDNPTYARTAERTAAFVLRDMRAADGLFYAGFDADSKARDGDALEEGLFYLWTAAELEGLLGSDGSAVAEALAIDDDFPILGQTSTAALPDPSLASPALDAQLERLRQARALRPAPFLDTKRITAWNAQMIAALATAARLLAEQSDGAAAWRAAAITAGDRLWDLHWQDAGLLRFSLDQQDAATPAVLQDYAFAILAYLALHDLEPDTRLLDRAQSLAASMTERFWQAERGLFISQARNGVSLFATPIDSMDSSQPSDVAAAVLAMVELDRHLGDREIHALANEALAGLSGRMAEHPEAHATAWRAGLRRWQPKSAFAGFGLAEGGLIRAQLAPWGLAVTLAPGWHINALEPLQDELIATELSWQAADENPSQPLAPTQAPALTLRTVAYYDQPVAEYHGDLRFALDLPEEAQRLRFSFQACNDRICLAPQSLSFLVRP